MLRWIVCLLASICGKLARLLKSAAAAAADAELA